MPIQRMPLAIGRGLDRATGQVAVSAAAPIDARNVYALNAKMALRPGMAGTGFPPLAWGTDILAEVGVKATLDVLFVVYDRPSGDVRIYRLDTINGVLQTIVAPPNGLWGTLDPDAEFPIVLAAEADGIVMFAHCEPNIANRLPTIYYTPDAIDTNVGTLTTLVVDLVGDGIAVASNVYFSGVIAYTDYMCGWGFGSVNDPDRGDIFRLAQPTAPLDWRPPNYAIFGVKKDPIIACCPTAGPAPVGASGAVVAGITSVLVVCKSDESYILNGTSFDNFEPQLLDSRYGVISPRAMQNVGGVAYGWSSDGARLFASDKTTPIAHPLELASPLPDDFAARGPGRECFSTYDLDRYLISWLFPDSVSAAVPVAEFMLSLWDPADPRWSFSERQQPVTCAGILLSRDTGSLPPAPIGYVSAILADDNGLAGDPQYRSVNLQWTNNKQTGTELVQLFARPAGGAWSLVTSFPVSGDADQQAVWDTALPVTSYDLAMRYANEQTPAVGYTNDDPDDWTASTAPGSKTTVVTTSEAVAWTGGTFIAPLTPVNLTWASAQVNAPYLLEKSLDGGGTYTTVAADLLATNYAYVIPSGELGTTVRFRLTAQRDLVVGPTAGTVDIPMYIVVAQPTWGFASWGPSTRSILLVWNAAANALTYLIEKSVDGGTTWVPLATWGLTNYLYSNVPDAELNLTLNFRVTGQNGSVSSTPSANEPVVTTFVIGQPTLTLTAQTQADRQAGVQNMMWTAAANAALYVLEKSDDGGATWSSVGTTSTLAAAYNVNLTEIAATVQFRVTGQNGTISGTPSLPQSVTFAIDAGQTLSIAPVYTGATSGPPRLENFTWSVTGSEGDVQSVQLWSGTGALTPAQNGASPKAGTTQRQSYLVGSGAIPHAGSYQQSTPLAARAYVLYAYLGGRYFVMSADVAVPS